MPIKKRFLIPVVLVVLSALMLLTQNCSQFTSMPSTLDGIYGGGAGGYKDTPLTVMNLGGGGNNSGIDFPVTGVKFLRGDTFGGYIFGDDGVWHLINGLSNLCPGGLPCPYFGWYPANTSDNQKFTGEEGVMELAGCPSSASCAYMYYSGWVFYSSNISTSNPGAITWCNTGFTQTAATANNAGGSNNPGPIMAVDPSNPAHVIVGTPSTGLFETFNGTTCGGASWSSISTGSIPLATNGFAAYLIAFDPTSTATCHTGSGTCAKNAYIANGTGVYSTTNAGASWSLMPGNPGNIRHLKVSPAAAGGGNVWAVDQSNNIWEYTAGSWTKLAGVTGGDVAINPNNGNHVAIGNGKTVYVSTNGASPSPTFSQYTGSLAGGDSPWAMSNQIIYFAGTTSMAFDPKNNDNLFMTSTQWIWQSPLPSGPFTWNVISSGIQGTVNLSNLQVAAPGSPTFSYMDTGSCTFSIATASTPPSKCSMPNEFAFLYYISGLSVAPGTTYMASKSSNDFAAGFDLSGYSLDGFKNNYYPYNLWNSTIQSSGVASNGSGYRITLPTTSGLSSFSPGHTFSNKSILCFLWEKDYVWPGILNSTCWPISVVDATHVDLIGSTYNATAATAGTDYLVYVPAPPLSSWFGGGTVLNVANNGAGKVRVTFRRADVIGANSTPVCISGVTMSGSTVVNGCWTIAATDNSTYIDLSNSTYNGDSYVTGGTVSMTGAPGGSVAASTSQNIAIYGTNVTVPLCTTNGGATWSEVNVPGALVGNGVTVTGGPYSAGTTSITVSNGAGIDGNHNTLTLTSGRLIDEAGSVVGGNTVTLAKPIPPGDSLASGSPIYTSTGGPWAAYFRTQQLAADKVTPNTFYYANNNAGLAKWTNCNAPVVVAPKSQGFLVNAYNHQLKTVPGQAGHLFFSAGSGGYATHPGNVRLWRACNGQNSTANSVTMQIVPGFFEVLAFGFGHAAPGKSYPAIYAVGWYSPNNTINDAVYGVWRSTDDANAGVNGTCSAGNTWVNLAASTGGFPAGFPVTATDIEGDPYVFGPYYFLGGFGQFYGVQNE